MMEGKGTGRDARILIVDDEPHLLHAASRLLNKAGYQIVEAATGQEGLRLARETKPDLVLLDMVLPDTDGFEVCRCIKGDAELRGTFVILLSGAKTEAASQVMGLAEGVDDCIVRPISNGELLVRVEAMLRLKQTQDALQKRTQELDERVKELNCLYGISQLIETPGISLEEILQATAHLIPPAWQHPEITCARILLDGQEFTSENFQQTAWKQTSDLIVHGQRNGCVEVYYLKERPQSDEGLFLEEEKNLLDAITKRLGRVIERIRGQDALRESERRFKALYLGLPVPVYAWQRSGEGFVLVDHNDAAKGITAGLISDFLGTTATAMYPDRPDIVEDISRSFAEKTSFQREMDYQFKTTGENKNLAVKYAFVPPDLVLVHTEDITARKQMEEALRESESRLELAVAGSSGGMWHIKLDPDDPSNTLPDEIFLSPGLKGFIGYEDEEFPNSVAAWESHVLPDDLEKLRKSSQECRQGQTDQLELEYQIRHRNGSIRWLYTCGRVEWDEDGRPVRFAGIDWDITERKRAEKRLEEAAAVAERERLARDLHDAVTQTLFSVAAIAEALPRVWERNPEEGRHGLEELRWLTQGALAEMRTMLLELRPAALAERSLGELLRQLTDAMIGRTRIPVTMTMMGDRTLPAEVQIALYRIAQEALNNIAKHARASQAKVSLHCEPGEVKLRISDDGYGFDPETAEPHQLGLGIMRERAQAIGASLEIESRPSQGTEVKVHWQESQEGQNNG